MSDNPKRSILRSVEVIDISGLTEEDVMTLVEEMKSAGVRQDHLVIFTSNSTLKAEIVQEPHQTILSITVDEVVNFEEFACLMENLIQLRDCHHMLSIRVENLSEQPMVANLPIHVTQQIEHQNEIIEH